MDDSGDVYVTGGSQVDSISPADYATVSYDSQGNELWAARYTGPGDDDDYAVAVAVDGAGNVYVTGSSVGAGTFADYLTIKYDSAGNVIWEARYDGPESGGDKPTALAVDSVGNAYVTGGSEGSAEGDCATIKYGPEGNLLWVARYSDPSDLNDAARALAVDASGNVFVTGASRGRETSYDYATIKYDAAGNELWVARYTSPGSHDDEAGSIALDAEGDVYVTGSSGEVMAEDYRDGQVRPGRKRALDDPLQWAGKQQGRGPHRRGGPGWERLCHRDELGGNQLLRLCDHQVPPGTRGHRGKATSIAWAAPSRPPPERSESVQSLHGDLLHGPRSGAARATAESSGRGRGPPGGLQPSGREGGGASGGAAGTGLALCAMGWQDDLWAAGWRQEASWLPARWFS